MERDTEFRCVAGILVGGQSRRMGRPKATLPLPDGCAWVEHVASVASRMGAWIDETVILGHFDGLPASLANARVLADVEPGAGPLAGLGSLLDYAGQRWGLLLACDMPLLQPPLLERLRAGAAPDCDAIAFRADLPNSWHACCALYHPRLRSTALQELRQGNRSMQNLLAMARVSALRPTLQEQRMLMNLNTPQDCERLLCRI